MEKDTLWAEKGYELAFSEAVLPGNWSILERKRFIPARMIDGDVNLGVILGEMAANVLARRRSGIFKEKGWHTSG